MTGLITDPEFNLNRTEEYKLSILVSQDGFSFSVIHEREKKLLAFENFSLAISSGTFLERHLKTWIENNIIFQKNFQKTRIIYYSEKFTYIPSAFYNSGQKEAAVNLVLGTNPRQHILENYLPNATGYIIFPVSGSLVEMLNKNFSGNNIIHPMYVLDSILPLQEKINENSMLLYFGKKSFSMLLYIDSRLQATNSFDYSHSDDVVYYTLSVLKKIKINPKKTDVHIAVETDVKSNIYTNLNKYYNQVTFFKPDILPGSKNVSEPSIVLL